MLNQNQMTAECGVCRKKWTVNVGEYGNYSCPYCPSQSVKLSPLYENKEMRTPKQKER